MSYVLAAPEMMAAAAADVAAVGSTLSAAHLAAVAPTVAVLPAAADEVSAGIAQVFSRAAQEYHALAGKAAAFGQQFVQHLNASAGSYLAAEAANAASLLHLTAGAGAAASAIPDLPSLLTSALTGLANGFSGALNDLGLLGQAALFVGQGAVFLLETLPFFAQAIPFLVILVTYATLLATFVTLAFADLILKAALLFGFGIAVPF
ncbi:PE family protein [Mycobacterium sp. E796]|uniref:PE family protein n=1 Tax=Mycobacterium sp. E796 TaxID=1834151 RepID=UPI0007FD4646|nr:PE family protein [Mycobacterium sp. E796]OBI41148.1 hypothetical protein A5706_08215 [Mycobacterium sp. E796]